MYHKYLVMTGFVQRAFLQIYVKRSHEVLSDSITSNDTGLLTNYFHHTIQVLGVNKLNYDTTDMWH